MMIFILIKYWFPPDDLKLEVLAHARLTVSCIVFEGLVRTAQ